jgi:hypothetical protein
MWEINVDEELLKELRPQGNHALTELTLTIRTVAIRDGTPGLSLAIGEEVIGEWTDSRVESLALTEDHRVEVHGQSGDRLYLINTPLAAVGGKQLSDAEVTISLRL